MMIQTPQFTLVGSTEKLKKEEEEDGYFGKLPDDLIFNILDRVNDSKFLTQCLLVSKRIASLIRLLSNVLVNIPHPPVDAIHGDLTKISLIWYSMFCFHDEPTRTLHDDDDGITYCLCPFNFIDKLASFYMCKAVEELHPFGNVKTAIVDYPKFDEISQGTNMRCMVEYSGVVTTNIRRIIKYSGAVTRGVIKSCAFIGKIDNCRASNGCYSLKRNILTWVASSFWHAYTLHPMVARMVQDHESLRDILITTASGNSWIHAGEDEIVKMRRHAGDGADITKMMQERIRMNVNVWYVPNSPTSIYAFVVVSSIRNIDREVKSATRKFWGDCSYWAGHYDEVIQLGIEKNMRELVETVPCHFEGGILKSKVISI